MVVLLFFEDVCGFVDCNHSFHPQSQEKSIVLWSLRRESTSLLISCETLDYTFRLIVSIERNYGQRNSRILENKNKMSNNTKAIIG